MDKSVMFAVAGSGKTKTIIDRLNETDRFLIITYTRNNYDNIIERILLKFERIPEKITVYKYFTFLYNFCYKPFIGSRYKAKGFYWNIPPFNTNKIKRDKIEYYQAKDGRLYHNRLAKMLKQSDLYEQISARIEKYFDHVFLDEIQDFAGHDFNFLSVISASEVDTLMVGDFYQHTFDTSRDGQTNKNLHKDYSKYKQKFEMMGIQVDTASLEKSYRCSIDICQFITNSLHVHIGSKEINDGEVKMIETEAEADVIFDDDDIVKLFLQEHYKYSCYSRNWGECKGEDRFQDVCVVLNENSYTHLIEGRVRELPQQTINKLYVACSRPKGKLFLVNGDFYKKFKN
jgi:DNA helicase-2/ATP-dependent DNA helicase PcrA